MPDGLGGNGTNIRDYGTLEKITLHFSEESMRSWHIGRLGSFRLLTLVLSSVAGIRAAAQEAETSVDRVSGTVFVDTNANGSFDSGEKPLAGIRITDSVGFVSTDDQGRFSIQIADDIQIPYAPARVVSVSWPSGFWPTGRWWRRLSELKPGEELAFGLREDSQPLPFVFAQVGDCHGGAAPFTPEGPFARLFTEQFGPALKFCVHAGDYGYCSTEVMDSMFETVVKNTRGFPVPLFFNCGNHDVAGRKAEDWKQPRYGYWGYTKYLGPVRWSFSYGGVHFTTVDWADISSGDYHEGAPVVAAKWLEQDLTAQPQGTRTFLFVHHPSGTQAFLDTVAKHKDKVCFVFGGHTHKFKISTLGATGVPRMTVLNAASVATVAVLVQDDRFDLIHYCGGCKHGARYHSKGCAISPKDKLFGAWAGSRKGEPVKMANTKVAGGPQAVLSGNGDGVEVRFTLEPGSAKRSGLRLGRVKPVEVAFENGKTLMVAGTPVPFVPREKDAGVKCHLAVSDGKITVFADDLLRFTREIDCDEPAVVQAFAEGGDATFGETEAWVLGTVAAAAAIDE